nr:MAG TPA: tail completion protein [Caudoviricetes sp.]
MRHPSAIVVSCLKRWLKGSEFDGVHVATKVPDGFVGPMVRVDAAAPDRETPVTDRTRIMLQVYGTDDEYCVDLLSACLEGMEVSYRAEGDILDWDTDTDPYIFPDPDRPSAVRWQAGGTLWTALS